MGAHGRQETTHAALLDMQAKFADVAAAVAGLVAQIEAQGFTAEQAREIVTTIFIAQRKAQS